MVSTTLENLKSIILGLGTYVSPLNALLKQNHAMHRRMRKSCGFKVRGYFDRVIDIDKYLDVLPGAKASDKIFETGLNEIVFNIIPNSWIRKTYVQGFDCEYIT